MVSSTILFQRGLRMTADEIPDSEKLFLKFVLTYRAETRSAEIVEQSAASLTILYFHYFFLLLLPLPTHIYIQQTEAAPAFLSASAAASTVDPVV